MTAEQLRNSLLQEAISGRLVPQDPNDEPASALLARIREEKERLIKEKKLKKEKPSAPITEDEIPFEIPSSWEWVRLSSFVDVRDGTHDSPKYYPNGIPFVTSKNLKNGGIDFSSCTYISLSDHQKFSERSFVEDGDILYAMIGSIGNPVIVSKDREFSIKNVALFKRYSKELTNIKYLFYYLLYIQKDLKQIAAGGVQSFVGLSTFRQYPIPIPPLAEQQRIVAKLEELLPIVEQYGKAQTELDELNAALPSRLRLSVLNDAIQGKLIAQDKNETVDELVHNLQRALKESPIKKKWCPEEIQEDELPFDIPENWQWVRLGDIIYTQTGLSYSKGDLEKKVPNPVRVLRGGNIQSGSWCIKDDDVMIAPEFVKKDIFLKKNSFITPAVTSLEHLGKTALIREDHNDIVAGGFVLYLMPYDATNDALMEYLAYFFQSAFFNVFCRSITNKSGQAFWNISREKLLQLPIPLPPLAEQQRIVAKIEELFKEIDKLK